MSEALLQVKGLYKTFGGIHALSNVDLTINKGEIHCLAGINGSGKSTLIKCVSGIYQPDAGEIVIEGETFKHITPQEAIEKGIQVIYQDLSLFAHLTIAENIAINRMMNNGKGLVSMNEVYRIAKEQTNKIGVELQLNKTIQESTMSTSQLTAICRALAMDAKLIFMDEPTTALTGKEVRQLLNVVLDLKKKGYAIVFISHKLDEIFNIADTISVFRDGCVVGHFKSQDLDKKKLALLMTGKDVQYPYYERKLKVNEPVLEVNNLTKEGNYEDVSFSIRPGDIVGITGLLGSGRTELALTLFGLNGTKKGSVVFHGQKIKKISPWLMKKKGLSLLPENRATQGLFINRSIKDNLTSVALENCKGTLGRLDKTIERDNANRSVEDMNIKVGTIDDTISTLSGGNQQKAVIGKWIATNPSVFIMDSPTVGIDVGSKAEIYRKIQTYAENGMAIIIISDEIEEIILNCNRILVMSHGKIISKIEEDERNSTNRDVLESRIMGMISESDLAEA